MMPKIDMSKFKYELNNKFRINIKNKIVKSIVIILIETKNNDFE
jgi:hypothetical protein